MKPQTFSGQNQQQLQVRRPEGERAERAEVLDGGQWGTWAAAAGLARRTGRSGRWLRATASGEDIWEPVPHPHLCKVPHWGTSHEEGCTLAGDQLYPTTRQPRKRASLPSHPHREFALCPSKMQVEFNVGDCLLPFACKLSSTRTFWHIPWRQVGTKRRRVGSLCEEQGTHTHVLFSWLTLRG